MVRIRKANITDDPGNDGIWIIDDSTENALYIPLSLCIVIADAITFSDYDIVGTHELAGYIEIFYDYNGDIHLFDGTECVIINKEDVVEFSKQLWDLI